MRKDRLVASMFHRRLILLMCGVAAAIAILGVQMFRLAIVHGAEYRAEAESKLDRIEYLPTVRGAILDRHNNVLAEDRPSYDLAVQYTVITGSWVREQARAQVKKEVGRGRWAAMSPEERTSAVDKAEPHWIRQREQLWQHICRLGGLTQQQLFGRLDEIKKDVQSIFAWRAEEQRRMEEEKYGVPEGRETEDWFAPQPIREQQVAHVLLPRIRDEVAFELRSLQSQFPEMYEVIDSRRRDYPWLTASVPISRASLPELIRSDTPIDIKVTGVADHILGAMRDEAWAEDLARRPFTRTGSREIDLGGYIVGDPVGSRGLERVFEDSLRGSRGMIRKRLDTGKEERAAAAAGADLHLTIDIALQARVQAILSPEFGLTKVQPWQQNHVLPVGRPLNSAAVVIEVETGEILAMVSMPTIAMGSSMTDLQKHINAPLVNRAAEAVYPPGSILKPLVLAAAVTEKVHDLGNAIQCTGHYFESRKDIARCWIYRERYGMRTHEALRAEEALARSCNIFFFTLADRLGMDRLCKWLRALGMGSPLDVGLLTTQTMPDGTVRYSGEGTGSVPSAQDIAELRRRGEADFSEVIMGIGQGPIAWTPVQAANAFATLARAGTIHDATLIGSDSSLSAASRTRRRQADLHLSKSLVDAALEGLRQSVEESHGTGYHITHQDEGWDEPIINAEKVTVWAKTGTAQAPPMPQDSNQDGRIDARDTPLKGVDHSWFVGLVGPKGAARPLHAVAVIVEYGGSGGRTAGPIANQIVRALQVEGYLPGDGNAPVKSSHKSRQDGRTQPEDDGRQE